MNYDDIIARLEKIHTEFMDNLSGSLLANDAGEAKSVLRSVYVRELDKIQEKYGLREGHPDFMLWILLLLGRSPCIIDDEREEN